MTIPLLLEYFNTGTRSRSVFKRLIRCLRSTPAHPPLVGDPLVEELCPLTRRPRAAADCAGATAARAERASVPFASFPVISVLIVVVCVTLSFQAHLARLLVCSGRPDREAPATAALPDKGRVVSVPK